MGVGGSGGQRYACTSVVLMVAGVVLVALILIAVEIYAGAFLMLAPIMQ